MPHNDAHDDEPMTGPFPHDSPRSLVRAQNRAAMLDALARARSVA